jgi:hypothetical protein
VTADANPAVDDAEFLRRFEACEIPLSEWNHRAHLRVAYLYLGRCDLDGAVTRMREGIRRHNAARGIVDTLDRGYHETLTQMWIRILYGVQTACGRESGFDAFLERHPYLLVRLLGRLFYTRDRMMSAEAKRTFVPPDITPLPGDGARPAAG